jgi:GNAT superfamily N-acetyltransferase
MINIREAETPTEIEEARRLFREYENWFGLDLCFQNFDKEVADLPGKYAGPAGGRLLLAMAGETIAGCIALRKIEDGVCEMKRLFVRPGFQGQGIGKMLIERLISEAQAIGYRKMRLDSYPPKMQKAIGIYRSYGFREIPAYYHNPYSEAIYLELVFP